MCGIVGIVGNNNVNQEIYDALTVLQHRGQDAAGIVTWENGVLNQRKANGLVRDVFRTRHMRQLQGKVGIGHVRYPTAGSSSPALAQPFYVNSPYGIALAHNGNLTNADALSKELFREDLRHINTSSDSEVLLNVFAHELQRLGKLKPSADDIFEAVKAVHKRCQGGYAVVAMVANYGIVAFRDPYGIRPIVFGERETDKGMEYMVASESVALDVLGFKMTRDIAPGEAVFISNDAEIFTQQCAESPKTVPCIFEHVYFARPDSIMDGISVYKTRMRMGEKLAAKILAERPDHDIDVVIPIPDTSRVSAQSLAYKLGVKFREGLMKNRYIGRTFIMPGQKEREKSVKQKLNAIDLEFEGKNVLLVDDSIVRGTTCRQIIEMAREAGAKKVYFASAAPAVKHQNVYGIDMPSAKELIAHGRSTDEICELIGADWLIYQELPDLIASCSGGKQGVTEFDCSVFNAEYVAGDINAEYLEGLEQQRSDDNKAKDKSAADADCESFVALYNDVS
ncbi:amidophosphoribosyltransferase [uncultured Paraglaciecola sp.]|uniref:amidophosphoribosyltransferase n=1 Tax=uncultured Paraglaciecola sp. TaxID=1765024 RepID=UPI0026331202|nr:amidophosphoribosyltransferase [uncultured Paraglaciecola sp.]